MKLKNDTEKGRELISLTSKRLIHNRGNRAVFFLFRLSRIKDRRIVEIVIGHVRIRGKKFQARGEIHFARWEESFRPPKHITRHKRIVGNKGRG